MASQRVDIAFLRVAGRLARGFGGDALLPAQDEKDVVPDTVLGHCDGVAGCDVDDSVR